MAAYTPAQDQALAAEIVALSQADPIVLYLTDYGAMRAANRACLASQGAKK